MAANLRNDVLIIGAGPSGLVLALWLNKLGVNVRVIDKAAGPGTTSRALVVHARTLELYGQLDLSAAVTAGGYRADVLNMWAGGKRRARVEIGAIGKGMTPFPGLEVFPQDEHEKLLVSKLIAAGIEVERNTELLDFTDLGTSVRARFRNAQGIEETCEALFIAGCDGARSLVRQKIIGDFPGGTYRQIFYVADVRGSGQVMNGEVHVDIDEADFLLVFGMERGERVRLVGVVSDERAEHAETLTFADVSRKVIRNLQLRIDKVDWFSTYHVHHRVATHFRKGRAFLVGDAGHIHSPVGGQGMNTGIGDAINLAWKLAAVVQGKAGDKLLDSYEAERIPFARRLVNTTDRMFTLATSPGRLREVCAYASRPAADAAAGAHPRSAAVHVPHGLPDHDHLPGWSAGRRHGRAGAWRRSPALGACGRDETISTRWMSCAGRCMYTAGQQLMSCSGARRMTCRCMF